MNEISQDHQQIRAAVAAYVEQLEQEKFELSSWSFSFSHSNTHSYRSSSTNSHSCHVTAAAEVAAAGARLKYLRIETEKTLAPDEVCITKRDFEIAEAKLKAIQIEGKQNDFLLPADNVQTYLVRHSASKGCQDNDENHIQFPDVIPAKLCRANQ